MKIYKNKNTGWSYFKSGVTLYSISGTNGTIPASIAEFGNPKDWEIFEEGKPEPEVPPGIVAFKWNGEYNFEVFTGASLLESYYDFVKRHFKYGHTIKTIKDNKGVEWSVGEDFMFRGFKHKVTSFKWETSPCNHWMLMDGSSQYNPEYSEKIPERKPIVTLQGKDLYAGDVFYSVSDDWEIYFSNVGSQCTSFGEKYKSRCYKSKELAEQYVRDNKPVYPAGLMDEVLAILEYYYYTNQFNQDVADTLNKVKAFKPTF